MTRLLRRVAASPAARDLRDVRLASPAWAVVFVLLLVAITAAALLTRDVLPTWSGFVPVPR